MKKEYWAESLMPAVFSKIALIAEQRTEEKFDIVLAVPAAIAVANEAREQQLF